MLNKFIFSLLLLFLIKHSNGQNDSVNFNRTYFKSFLTDTKDIVTAPIYWKLNHWIIAGTAATASATLVFKEDKNIQQFFQHNRTILTNNLSSYAFKHWGDGLHSLATMGFFYGYGLITKKNRPKKVALLGVKTFIITGIINYIPKNIFHRERPFVDDNPFVWHGPFKNFKDHSFPSGHTMSAFAMATIVASEYKEYKIVPVICYSIATLTGLSRINDNKHWASDVLMGGVLGWAMAKCIYNKNNWGVVASPYFSEKTSGMVVKIPIKQG